MSVKVIFRARIEADFPKRKQLITDNAKEGKRTFKEFGVGEVLLEGLNELVEVRGGGDHHDDDPFIPSALHLDLTRVVRTKGG